MYALRPYQQKAKEAVLSDWQEGYAKTLLVLPTGTGKTIVFASITEELVRQGKRVLILAHREELLEQAADKLKNATGLNSVFEKAEMSNIGSNASVVIGSVQTMTQDRRLSKFSEDYFDAIIIDEAHHCLSNSYQKILRHFPDSLVLGVTATPDRGDMQNLGKYFDHNAYSYSLAAAVKDGYLCPIKAQMIPLELDIENVGLSSGDFSAGGIGHALEPYLDRIAEEMVRYCCKRKTVVFLPLIEISQKFCRILNSVGFNAVEVNGKSIDRTEKIDDFEAGVYNVLCNSMLLTEGWDCPSVDCIIVLRPTKIRSLYQQMVGRGMRLAEGKKDLLLLDFLWLTKRHDLCRPSALVSKSTEIAEKIDESILDSAHEVDLLGAEKNAEKDIMAERESALIKQLKQNQNKKRELVDPLQYAISIQAEDLTNYKPVYKWEKSEPTEKQLEMLKRRGIDTETVTTKGMASMIIGKLIERQGFATPKQIRYLESRGFQHVGTWSFDQATNMMSKIENNNWRIPWSINPKTYIPKNA